MSDAASNTKLSMKRIGHACALFLAISFVTCIAWGLLTPQPMHMHEAWKSLLPGFVWLTPVGFAIGLVESYLYGWWIALVFVPLYNRFG
ncbi:hypothetical protein MNBD_ALPHA06-285 [hydrothermal vent metagenome]|uniref:Uncharacterized protein n=1 Tax=hydrothermal vent metagenome TaxID=652676 RepID=A0A3B0S6X4_9ZZZZ